MKSFSVVAAVALAVAANAQFQGLPQCAQDCANSFLLNGIGNCGRDVKCICSDKAFLGDISCCLAKPGGCGPDDQAKAVSFASQICAAAGVQVPNTVVCSTGTAASTSPTAAASGSGSSSSGPASSPATPTAASASPSSTTSAGKNWGSRPTAAPAAGVLGGIIAAVLL